VGKYFSLKRLERFILSSFGSSVVSQKVLNSSSATEYVSWFWNFTGCRSFLSIYLCSL